MTYKLYDTDSGETIGERAQNKATAKVMAQREANSRGKSVSYQEVGSRYAFVAKPEASE